MLQPRGEVAQERQGARSRRRRCTRAPRSTCTPRRCCPTTTAPTCTSGWCSTSGWRTASRSTNWRRCTRNWSTASAVPTDPVKALLDTHRLRILAEPLGVARIDAVERIDPAAVQAESADRSRRASSSSCRRARAGGWRGRTGCGSRRSGRPRVRGRSGCGRSSRSWGAKRRDGIDALSGQYRQQALDERSGSFDQHDIVDRRAAQAHSSTVLLKLLL